jgi:hypothetical protein
LIPGIDSAKVPGSEPGSFPEIGEAGAMNLESLSTPRRRPGSRRPRWYLLAIGFLFAAVSLLAAIQCPSQRLSDFERNLSGNESGNERPSGTP